MPAQHVVDAFLPPYAPAHRLDPAHVESWGNVVTQDMFHRHRQALEEAMSRVTAAAVDADRQWQALTGRGYGVIERYRCDDADTIIVAMAKVVVPRVATAVIDRAIQVHGAAGVSDDTPLAAMYGWHRAMRVFDGPDEVHLRSIARHELKRERRFGPPVVVPEAN